MKLLTLLTLVTLNCASILTANAENLQQDQLPQSNNLVKAGNKFVTLLGTQVAVGEAAPDFKVVNEHFAPVKLSDFVNKTVLISVVPSLDTGVCSLQTKRFNEEVANLPENVTILTVSNDLPFAQKRFCKNENIDKVKVLSDAVWRELGSKYGLLIKDMGLLTRAIFIIDQQGIIAYKELVANISEHPDYETALSTLKALHPQELTEILATEALPEEAAGEQATKAKNEIKKQ
ncbi:thiol peroxidase [Thalassomonas actiniarum]|uniref:Thiol peroxidase n=1 Tax=Thalassomonas actiniarum TaxID=485447 RepID=A0AAF0BZ35_9GAMM|nr:thiol peroxidase [Thalassomonas actiniarum]WDD97761.1 thiol peroxidase [Thalassomonas actiniarum]